MAVAEPPEVAGLFALKRLQATVAAAGQTMVGAETLVMITVVVQVLKLPAASVTVNVTVCGFGVVLQLKVAGLTFNVAIPQLSLLLLLTVACRVCGGRAERYGDGLAI